jgi:hypothetical protein
MIAAPFLIGDVGAALRIGIPIRSSYINTIQPLAIL